MLKQLRDFLLRGNAVDLAVAVVVGAAFGAVVSSLVSDIITPLIAAVFGKPDFGGLTFTIHNSVFRYGSFINAVITFVLVGTAVFFLVVQPVDYLMERRRRGLEPEPVAVPEDVALLAEIRDLLRDQSSGTTPSRPT
jgi:large conductance mechanosensitive channel